MGVDNRTKFTVLARGIAQRLPRCRVTALDISPESLDLGERLARRSGLANFRFVEPDAAAMPFGDAAFDRGLADALTEAGFDEVTRTGFSNARPFQTIEAISAASPRPVP